MPKPSKPMQCALDAVADMPAPTHAIYTPTWQPEGGKFRAWRQIGIACRGEDGGISGWIDTLPWHPEENFTGHFRLVAIGAERPAPLTTTKEEFLEAEHLRSERS